MKHMTITEAQGKVLGVVDAHGASAVGNRLWDAMNTVPSASAYALVRLGVLETFSGPDSFTWVRRVKNQ